MKYIEKIVMAVVILGMLFTLGACAESPSENSDATQTPTAVVTPTPEAPTPTPDDGKVTYTVKVVDENNNPVENAGVQLCLESCFPGFTNADGIVTFDREEANYKVTFLPNLPAGYTYSSDVTEFYFEEGSTEITLTLKRVE